MNEPLALQELRERRLVAVIRAPSRETALESALAVARGGLTLLEITFIADLSVRSDLTVGAGTVLTAAQAREAIGAGARFVVAPNLSAEVARASREAGVMFCPGAYTTSEIMAAHAAGAHVVKVYPVGVAGGPDYIRVIRDPLPTVLMLAAGGTTLDNFVPFLRAGCIGVGLGASLADPKLAAAGSFDEITRRARAFVERLARADTPESAPRA